jgi:hypothetical protein
MGVHRRSLLRLLLLLLERLSRPKAGYFTALLFYCFTALLLEQHGLQLQEERRRRR